MKKLFYIFATALLSVSMFAATPVNILASVAQQKAKVARVHKAPAATTNSTYVALSDLLSIDYRSANKDWLIVAVNSEHRVTLDFVSESGMLAGEYLTEDAILSNCVISGSDGNNPEPVVSLEMTISTESPAVPQVAPERFVLDCSLVTANNSYDVRLVVTPPLEPKRVINLNLECVDYDWPTCPYPGVAGMFIFQDTDVPSRAIQFAIDVPAGELTKGHGIVTEYTGMVDYSTLMPYMIDNGTATVDVDVDSRKLTMEVAMVCADTIQYNFTHEQSFTIAGNETLSYNNMVFDGTDTASTGGYAISAEAAAKNISGFIPTQALSGSLNTKGMTFTIGDAHTVKVVSATITAPGTISMVILGDDLVLYTINAQYTVVDPTPAEDPIVANDYYVHVSYSKESETKVLNANTKYLERIKNVTEDEANSLLLIFREGTESVHAGDTIAIAEAEIDSILMKKGEDLMPAFGRGTAKRTGDVDVNWIQLWENGPKFAEYNVGAENNQAVDFGGLYCWGSSIDKDPSGACKSGTDALSGTDDTATNLWGENWRMPTLAELQALLANCDVAWTTVNGVNGRKFTGKGDYASNSVFLPAGGSCYNGNVDDQGIWSYYWSSTPYGSDNAYHLYFYSDDQYVDYLDRYYGYSIRAVLAEE